MSEYTTRVTLLQEISVNGCDMNPEGCPLSGRYDCPYCEPCLYAKAELQVLKYKRNTYLEMANRLTKEEIAEEMALIR